MRKSYVEPVEIVDYSYTEGCVKIEWGLAVPGSAMMAWGFRAIKEGDGFTLLSNRQGWWHMSDDLRGSPLNGEFERMVDNTALPSMRRHAESLDASDESWWFFDFGTMSGMPVRGVHTPRGSYGYIYGSVWLGSKIA